MPSSADNSSTHITWGLRRYTKGVHVQDFDKDEITLFMLLLQLLILSFSSHQCSSIASLFFLNSSSCSWRIAEPCHLATISGFRSSSPGDGDFEEGVGIPAFFKKDLSKLFCERTLETTSALGNGGCPSAIAPTSIVSTDI